MPTTELEPTAQGNYNQWGLAAGANKWTALQRPNDDAASYNRVSNPNQRDSFVMADLPSMAAGGEINQVNIYSRVLAAGDVSTDWRMFCRLGGVDLDYTQRAMPLAWTSYTQADIGRPGTGTWYFVDVNSAEAGIWLNDGSTQWQNCTTLEMDVTWTPAAGSWTCLVVSLLGPVLGAGFSLAQMPELIAACNRAARGKHVIHGHEAVQMYEDLKANPHRSFCFLGKAA